MKRTCNFFNPIIFLIYLCVIASLHGNGQTKWRFAVLGDTHVGSSDTVSEMIPFMQADSISCILICGDIAEGGLACSGIQLTTQLTAFKDLFAPLYSSGIAVYPIRGNHEADAHDNIAAWNSVFSGSYALPQNGPSGEVNLTYSFNYKNALFVGLDNYVNIHTVNQNWLDQQLATNSQPHVFVFGHEAAFKVFHADCLDDSLVARNIFWQSLAASGTKAYFCGHDHFADVALIDDEDGNQNNDVYQYLTGTGGGWLMSQYSINYNGNNTPYVPARNFHEMEYGYALVEVSGDGQNDCDVTITWKKRTWNPITSSYEYLPTSNIIQYSTCSPTEINNRQQKSITISPNPSSDYINVSGISGLIKIYNSNGIEMWSGKINDFARIQISDYPSGLYFIWSSKTVNKFMILNNY